MPSSTPKVVLVVEDEWLVRDMLKLIAGSDRAIAHYARARNWTPTGGGRYIDEHGFAVRRLYQPEGLWGMSANNAKPIVLVPDDQGGAPLKMSQVVSAILTEAQKRHVAVEQIKVAA
jgi:hypothetical protein